MTEKDLKILDNLLERTEKLPDILHLRAAKSDYELTEEDKKLLSYTYQNLDDILKEVAAFINIKFPGCERHVRAWNAIDFDTKIGTIKVVTTNREHIKRDWRKGLFDLKSLIKILKNEVLLLIEDDKEKPFSTSIKTFPKNISSIEEQYEFIKEKKSWLEKVSWIAGIIGTVIALYTLLQ